MTGRRRARAPRTTTTAVGAALALLVAGAPSAAAQEVSTPRLAGDDRFETAVQVAAERLAGSDSSIETVLLARADDFPDALSGAGLAGHVGGTADISAPILLTEGEALTPATAQALRDFSTRRVVLLGGPAAISQAVEAQLAQDYDVTRIAGGNRYATAAEAARRLVANTGGLRSIGGQSTVLVASGADFADALAGGPVAYAAKVPVLLTAPGALPASTAAVLDELQPDRAIVLGGEAAVSAQVQDQIEQRGIATRRLGGADRQETAALIADLALREVGFDASDVLLARGDAFPDALAGAPEAGRTRAPILLTRTPAALGAPTAAWLQSRRDTVETVRLLGGAAAITSATAQQAAQAAGSGGGSQEPFPADTSPDTATASADARLNVVDMEFGRHAGFDRIVLELTGTGSPGWTVQYVDTPREQGSGNPVELQGDAFLQADITGVVLPTAPGAQPYTGPEQLTPEQSAVVREAEMGTVFEGHRQVFLGLSSRQPFRVFALDDPTRIVIDVQHGSGATTDQDFLVAPQEALTAPVGAAQEFRVLSRTDGSPFTGPVDLALFPCSSVDATGAGPVVFTDADGDRRADRIGETDTGAARIIGVNGAETNTTVFSDASPAADGSVRFHVNAAAADCTVPVVHDDEDGDGQLSVDAEGRGTEPFGVGKVTWQ